MLILGVVLAFSLWVVTIAYWLITRNRKKPLPPPETYEQLLSRIASLEDRLRTTQTQGEQAANAASSERTALDELRRQAVQTTTTQGHRTELPAEVQDQFREVERLLGTGGVGSHFDRMVRELGHTLRDPGTRWEVTTTRTSTRRNGSGPQDLIPPIPPIPPIGSERRTRQARAPATAAAPAGPPTQPRSVYERLRDPWPTNPTTDPTTDEEPNSNRPRRTT